MAELVQYECSRCGSRLQVLGQAQVWCRCGSPMQPVARAPVVEAVAGLVQRSMFDAVTDSQPARRANGRVSQRSRTGRISDLPKGEFADFSGEESAGEHCNTARRRRFDRTMTEPDTTRQG